MSPQLISPAIPPPRRARSARCAEAGRKAHGRGTGAAAAGPPPFHSSSHPCCYWGCATLPLGEPSTADPPDGGDQHRRRFKLPPVAVPPRAQVLKCRNRESGEIVAIKKFKSRIDGENADAAQVWRWEARVQAAPQAAQHPAGGACWPHPAAHRPAHLPPPSAMLACPPTLAALSGYVGAQDGAARGQAAARGGC